MTQVPRAALLLLTLFAACTGDCPSCDEPKHTGGDWAPDTDPLDTETAADSDTGGATEDTAGSATYVSFDLDDADAKLIGEEASDGGLGRGAMTTGDFSGDGVPDIVLGKPCTDVGGSQSGTAYVVYGPLAGDLDLSAANARLDGDFAILLGYAVANAGDTDGDGNDDLLVGAPGPVGEDSPGHAYLVRGPLAGELSLADADAVLTGENGGGGGTWADLGYAGGTVASAGDNDGDGFADILVAGVGYAYGRGAAYLLRGPISGEIELADADLRIVGQAPEQYLGVELASMDATGDGLADVLLTVSDGANGTLLVFDGPTSGGLTSSDADAGFSDSFGYGSGFSPAPAGDVDGDGYDDVWVYMGTDEGVVYDEGGAYLLPGPLSGSLDERDVAATLLGTSEREYAGASLAATGDVDGDGRGDLLVGTAKDEGWEWGSAYLVLAPFAGTRSLLDAEMKILGSDRDVAGPTVLGPGDMDGDGLGELLISGPGDDDNSGAAWLIYGSTVAARL